MESIKHFLSDRFLVQLSYSFSISQIRMEKELQRPFISLQALMDEKRGNFIEYSKLADENYLLIDKDHWDITNRNITIFNNDISNKGEQIARRQRLVAGAHEYGKNVFFLETESDNILDTTKIVATALAARSQEYHQRCLRESIKRYILPPKKVAIIYKLMEEDGSKERKNFLLIPFITRWGTQNGNNDSDIKDNKKDRFFTINLICLPENDDFNLKQKSEFINAISQPKHNGIRVVDDPINNPTSEGKLLETFFYELYNETRSTFFEGEIKKNEKDNEKDDEVKDCFESLMVSAICDFSFKNKICRVPVYSDRTYVTGEKETLSKILFSYLYHSFWMKDEMDFKDIDIPDIHTKLSQDQMVYYPYNITCFFSETKHLSLTVLLANDEFPGYSGIWALGTEILANENISTQLCLIRRYNEKLRKIDNENDGKNVQYISKILSEIRESKIRDFEPFYNMETDDSYLKHRIDKMQSKIGIQQKYLAMNQCLESFSALLVEQENKALQKKMTGLTESMTMLTWVLVAIGLATIVLLTVEWYWRVISFILVIIITFILHCYFKPQETLYFIDSSPRLRRLMPLCLTIIQFLGKNTH